MLARIAARVTRAAETVTQLLTLARLDPEQEFQRQPVLLNDLVIDLIAEEGHVAADRELDIRISQDPEVVVDGHREWLQILGRNLLGNAFKYSPLKAKVEITLTRSQNTATLVVTNDCEPISDAQRLRLTDRFYSLPGRDGGGVGLGLSIAKRIADLHGAVLRLDKMSGGRGFIVAVEFQLARRGRA